MSDIINYGMIGCGMMGQEHLLNIALLPDARVSAIFEPDRHMADAAKAIVPDARLCASIKELLAQEDLDCLLIVSPNFLHVGQFEEVAALRPLPLMIEKPLFTEIADAARLRLLEKNYPAPVWVAMEYRYMPPVQAFLEQLQSATGGPTMLTIREHRFPFLKKVGDWNRFNRYSGGTFVEKCCHFFDLMRLILASEPVRIMASAGQDVNHKDESYDGKVPDIWDAGFVIVDFENGSRAMLELCMYAEGSMFQEEMTALGPTGKIEAKIPGPGQFWPPHLGTPPISQVVISPRDPKGPQVIEVPVEPMLLAAGSHNGSTYYEHLQFLKVVRDGCVPDVTLQDGLCAVEMGLAAQLSARTGNSVLLSELRNMEPGQTASGDFARS
jgi:predicted dehydrogenase